MLVSFSRPILSHIVPISLSFPSPPPFSPLSFSQKSRKSMAANRGGSGANFSSSKMCISPLQFCTILWGGGPGFSSQKRLFPVSFPMSSHVVVPVIRLLPSEENCYSSFFSPKTCRKFLETYGGENGAPHVPSPPQPALLKLQARSTPPF